MGIRWRTEVEWGLGWEIRKGVLPILYRPKKCSVAEGHCDHSAFDRPWILKAIHIRLWMPLCKGQKGK